MPHVNQLPSDEGEPCTKSEELAFWLLTVGLVGLLISIARLIWSIRSALTGA